MESWRRTKINGSIIFQHTDCFMGLGGCSFYHDARRLMKTILSAFIIIVLWENRYKVIGGVEELINTVSGVI